MLVKPLNAATGNQRNVVEVLEPRIAPAGLLSFSGSGTVVVDLAAHTITDSSAPGSPVDFSGADGIQITAGVALTIQGTSDPDVLTFTPAGLNSGTVTADGMSAPIQFSGIAGALTIDPRGGGDVITLAGNSLNNLILATGGTTPTVQIGGTKALTLVDGTTAGLVIEALGGDDTLTVDSGAGAFAVPITYHGGNGFDTLVTQGGTATANVYQLGMTPDAGTRTLVIGGVTESITFTGLEPVLDTVAGALTVTGTNASNAITYRQGSVAANGLVAVDGAETIEFSNKTSLTINALGGDDVINLSNPTTPTGLTSITVNGGEPGGNDTLILNGTTGNNTFNFTPSNTVGSGSVTTAGAPTVTFFTIEQLSIDGQGGTDALTTTSASGHRVTYTPGSAPDSGIIEMAAFGTGTGLVPLSFAHIGALGSITFAGSGDILQINGTANSDTFNVTGSTVQLVNTTQGFTSVLLNLSNIFNAELRGLDGSDTFNVTGSLATFGGGIVIDGGNPSANDTVNLSGATGAVNVTLAATSTVTGYGSTVSLLGIEYLNPNAGTNNATLTATSGDDEVDVTPTGTDAVTFVLASSNPAVGVTPAVNFSNVGATLSVAGGTGTNLLTFHGTAAGDLLSISRNTGSLSLAVSGRQVVSPSNFASWQVLAGGGSDLFSISETGAVLNNIELVLDGGVGSNQLLFNTSFPQTFVPSGGPNGSFTGAAETIFTNIATATLTFVGPTFGANIQANGAANQITLTGTGASSVDVQVDDSTLVTFAGTLGTLNVMAGAGDDMILVTPGTFTGAGGFVINAGSPGADDRLVVAGTSGADTFTFSGTSATDGTVTITGSAPVAYTNARNVILDGLDGADVFRKTSALGKVEIRGGGNFGIPGSSAAYSTAQIYDPTLFTNGNKPAPGKAPTAVASGDLNGDGFEDIVLVNSKTANLSILINKGDGTFLDPVSFSTVTANPQDIVIGDFDGDSNPDAVVTFPKAGKIAFFKGDGAGSFAAPTGTATPKLKPFAIAAADLDGDLDLDLAVTSRDTNSVAVLLSDGAGAFTAGTAVSSSGKGPVDIVIADFNNDGSPDLATANTLTNNISLFRGDGLGGVAAAVRFAAGGRPTGLAAGDLDNDGDIDLAVSNAASRHVSVLLSAGNVAAASQFAPQLRAALPGQHQASAIAIGDFDRDGIADLGLGNSLGTQFTVLRGLGAGIFSQPFDFDLGRDTKPNPTSAIALADLNNDGLIDIITASLASSDLRTLLHKV